MLILRLAFKVVAWAILFFFGCRFLIAASDGYRAEKKWSFLKLLIGLVFVFLSFWQFGLLTA